MSKKEEKTFVELGMGQVFKKGGGILNLGLLGSIGRREGIEGKKSFE